MRRLARPVARGSRFMGEHTVDPPLWNDEGSEPLVVELDQEPWNRLRIRWPRRPIFADKGARTSGPTGRRPFNLKKTTTLSITKLSNTTPVGVCWATDSK